MLQVLWFSEKHRRDFADGISASQPLYGEKRGLALLPSRIIEAARAPLLIINVGDQELPSP